MTLTGTLLTTPLEPGSPEWLATYSASQVAAICGLSKWDTPRSIYDAKKGITPPNLQTDAMGRGHEFEPMIREWVAKQNPDWTITEAGGYAHHEKPNHTATPDGYILPGNGGPTELLEIKTAEDLHTWGDTPPIYYLVQVMWQMYVTGAPRCHIAACGPFELFNRRPRIFTIERNDQDIDALVRRVEQFDAALKAGVQPPADHSRDADRLAVRYANTTIVDDPGVEIPDELAVPYLTAYAAETGVQQMKAKAASELLEFLGSQKKATYRGRTIATRVNGRGTNPPTLRGATGLADLAADLLDTKAEAA